MTIKLEKSSLVNTSKLNITGSKSESNRLLILQALYPNISLKNLSTANDTLVLKKALISNKKTIDIHHAGTAMRFLTAYFASQKNKNVVLTGSSRMQERPIKILVDALLQLDATISYTKNNGFPPLQINGKYITKNQVSLNANVSSQYISALLLIAPKLENGLQLNLLGKITSLPYIKMTLSLLEKLGISVFFNATKISVTYKETINSTTLVIESDWSSASYYYSCIALSTIGTKITLTSYFKNSLQGDAAVTKIYHYFGVTTTFKENGTIVLEKTENLNKKHHLHLNLNNTPDIAQTIAVTCLALNINCTLTGLHTLKIKETDRLVALKNELEKFGAKVQITENSLTLHPPNTLQKNCSIATYNDHRMAMAFAPLALKTTLYIEDAEVVAKSYPDFWNHLKTIGITF